ncbi:MAG TPA: 5-formyltetrahydrofolate cyclo-ligase [Gammaproteobacteria bacterium]|nr:5-formyltetrahydrofolate cyclo-ligase [Gammaproteobacteria bacterium]
MAQNQTRLRALGRTRRRSLDAATRQLAQDRINHSLLAFDTIRRAQRIGVYLAMGSELDLAVFMDTAFKSGKQLFIPRIRSSHMDFVAWQPDNALQFNRFGIAQPGAGSPQKPQFLDVVITPLVAFDTDANRIGQGGGYYDRCFAWLKYRHYWRKPALMGAAFDCQCVTNITPNRWDIPLQTIITEKATYPCNTG